MANPLWAPDFTFSASCSLQPAQALGLQQQLYSQRASTQVCGEAENRAATAPLAGNKAEFGILRIWLEFLLCHSPAV